MAEIVGLLSASRLVTLCGPAGVGKTRLALETAAAASRYHDGAVLVELARVTDPRSVPQAVASALGLAERPGRGLADTVADDLAPCRLLLVVDNAEHLVAATSELIAGLLRACPQVSVLVTSQRPLGMDGESRWTVPPLEVPGPESDGDGDGFDMPESVALFCDRAAAVRSGFELDTASAPAVMEICRRLDGIPLAIELAAALVDTFSLPDIAARLDDRFTLLTRGSPAAATRHQKLEAALDWSYSLLSEPELVLFRRLGVFSGGATADAIAEVCGGGRLRRDRMGKYLSALANRSLCGVDAQHEPARYRLLETISQYARDRLDETPEADERRARHARWYLQLAESTVAALSGPGQGAALQRLDGERDNFNAALTWALAGGDSDLALRLCGALSLYWRMRCTFSEGRRWLEAALAAADPTTSLPWAWAKWGAGFLALMLGDFDAGVVHLEEALAVFRAHDDVGGCARSQLLLGNHDVFSAPAEAAVSRLDESVDGARSTGDDWCLSHALALLGLTYLRHGQIRSARLMLEESVTVARDAGDRQGLHFGLRILGLLALREGAYQESEGLLDEALTLTRELGETYGTADVVCLLGEVAQGRGDYDRAEELLEWGLALTRDTANPPALQETLCTLGRLYVATGETTRARRCFDEAGEVRGRSGPVLEGLAQVHLAAGELREAESLFGEVLASAGVEGDQYLRARVLDGLGRVARATGDERSAAHWHGQALALRHRVNDGPGTAESLEALAGVGLGSQDRPAAVRLLAVAHRLRQAGGYARPRTARPDYEADLAALRSGLDPDAFDAAWAENSPLDEVVALVGGTLVAGTAGGPELSSGGWDGLTDIERQVATLVTRGLSNKDVGKELFVSARTVGGHLTRIFAKLGVTSRAQMAREVKRLEGAGEPGRDGAGPPDPT